MLKAAFQMYAVRSAPLARAANVALTFFVVVVMFAVAVVAAVFGRAPSREEPAEDGERAT
jgi:hypothetical protein